jgi:hypothetical protein
MVTKRDPNAYDIYLLGTWLARLDRQTYGVNEWGTIRVCLKALSDFEHIRGLEFIGIEAEKFRGKGDEKYQDDDTPVEKVDAHILNTSIMRWCGRLDEISKQWILSLPKTHMDIDKLSGGAKSFLEEEEWNMFQPLEQQGLNEATACLLSNTFTSAEFIAQRTVESVLRRWYEKKTGNRLVRENWGDVLNELNEKYPKKSERPKELSLLDYLRKRRNEIAHPEAISNLEEATATFLNVINVCKAVKSFLLT